MTEPTYKLSTILGFIEKEYEDALEEERIEQIIGGLNNPSEVEEGKPTTKTKVPDWWSVEINDKILIEGKIFQIKRQSVEPWFCLQETRDQICENCANGDHHHCTLTECDCQ